MTSLPLADSQQFMTSPPLLHRQPTGALPHPETNLPPPGGKPQTLKRVWAEGEEVAKIPTIGCLRVSWGENMRQAGTKASGEPELINARRMDVDVPVDLWQRGGLRMKVMMEDDMVPDPVHKAFRHNGKWREGDMEPPKCEPSPPSDMGSPVPIFESGSKHFMHGQVLATWGESDTTVEPPPEMGPVTDPCIQKARRLDIDIPVPNWDIHVKIVVTREAHRMPQSWFDKVSKAQKRIEEAPSPSAGPSSPRSPTPEALPEADSSPPEHGLPPASPWGPGGSADGGGSADAGGDSKRPDSKPP